MPGTSFGKYRLLAELGHGGMADVFLAVQAGPVGSGFKKLTVIKRLRANLADEPEFIAMLVDEARIAARLNHPNVVQTNEVGEVGSEYFIAMEYLDGQPLHRIQHRTNTRLKENKPSPLSKESQYLVVLDALAGLHHAHELCDYDGTPLHIVHRDITPQNVFVTYEGQVKLVDFGIAKAAGRIAETRQGVIKGKVRYMAPEQAIGQAVDRRADVFSIGVMLWEVVTGRRMWKDMDDMTIVQALLIGNLAPAPRELDPSVPEALDRICRRALAHRADERYATAEAFRHDLEQFLAESGLLLDARCKLAPAICELFNDKRVEIKSIIEKQLADVDVVTSGEFQAVSIPLDNSSSATPVSSALTLEEQPTLLNDPKTAVYVPPPRGRGRAATATIIAVIAVLGVVLSVFTWKRTAHNAAAKTASVAQVSLRLTGSPSQAKVVIDDQPAMTLPIDIKVARDEREHRVRIEADGFIGRTELVSFGRDTSMSVDLVPMPPVVASQDPPPSRPPTVVTVVTVARGVPPAPPRRDPPRPADTSANTAAANAAAASAAAAAAASAKAASDAKRKLDPDRGDPWTQKHP